MHIEKKRGVSATKVRKNAFAFVKLSMFNTNSFSL